MKNSHYNQNEPLEKKQKNNSIWFTIGLFICFVVGVAAFILLVSIQDTEIWVAPLTVTIGLSVLIFITLSVIIIIRNLKEKRENGGVQVVKLQKSLLAIVLVVLPCIGLCALLFPEFSKFAMFFGVSSVVINVVSMTLGLLFGIGCFAFLWWFAVELLPTVLKLELPIPIERIWTFDTFAMLIVVTLSVSAIMLLCQSDLVGTRKQRAIKKAYSENSTSVCPHCGSRNITIYRKGYDYKEAFWNSIFNVKGGVFLAGMDKNRAMCACRDCNHRWESDREILVGGGFHSSGEPVTENDISDEEFAQKAPFKGVLIAFCISLCVLIAVNVSVFAVYKVSWETSFEAETIGLHTVRVENISETDYNNVQVVLSYQYASDSVRYTTPSIQLKSGEDEYIEIDIEEIVKAAEEDSGFLSGSEIMLSMKDVKVEKVIYS